MKIKIDTFYDSNDEYLTVALPYFLMEQNELVSGDYVIIKGGQDYPAIVISAEKSDKIIKGLRISKILQSLLEVKIGDKVELNKVDIKPAKCVFLKPLNTEVNIDDALLENRTKKEILTEMCCPEYKLKFNDFPVLKGISLIPDFGATVLVTNTIPKGVVLIDNKTKIELELE